MLYKDRRTEEKVALVSVNYSMQKELPIRMPICYHPKVFVQRCSIPDGDRWMAIRVHQQSISGSIIMII